ncbi:MAG: AI-2E family transporter [Candidatus Limnocylindrales bacterium]
MTTTEAGASPRLRAPTPRVALLIGAIVVVAVLFYLARGSLGPFVVGLALIYVLDPAVERLSGTSLAGRRMPRPLAVLAIYLLAIVGLGWGLSVLLGPLLGQIGTFADDFPAFQANLVTWYQGLDLPAFLRSAVDGVVGGLDDAGGGIDVGTLLPFARSVVGYLGSFLGYLIIPIWAFYLLKDRPLITAGINDAIPPTWRRDFWACVGIVNRVFGRWLRAQLFLGVVVGIATFVGLEILGVAVDPRFAAFAVLLAVIAGIFELLPIIGPILSMIPTLVVALTVADPLGGIIAVVILYLIVQQLENNILVPLIQSDAIDLHPSVVILALIVGGAIAGLMGAIFALPLTAAGRDVYRYAFRRLSTEDPDIRAADDRDLLPFRDRLPDANGRFPEPEEILSEDDTVASSPITDADQEPSQ